MTQTGFITHGPAENPNPMVLGFARANETLQHQCR